MASAHEPVVARKRRRAAAPNIEVRSQEIGKKEPRRRLRSSSSKKAQQLQKDSNHPSPPKTRKRPREAEVEQATDCGLAKRSRKLVQQPSPAQQPKNRKRPREVLNPLRKNSAEAPRKRARRSLGNTIVETPEETASTVSEGETDPIGYWAKTDHWPKGYAEQRDDTMSHLLARQKSTASLRRKRSELASIEPASVAPSSTTPSDQKPREVKSAPYQDPRYKLLLSTKGSFMDESKLGITEKSKETYLKLLDVKQTVPSDSLFRDDIFKRTCQNIQDRNEARVIRDISLLIVPSAETLATYGAEHLNNLIDSTNEGWNNSIPLTGTRPQPDYSVGFKREAFTKDQLNKLSPFIGDFIAGDQSYFMATYYMYFPFFTCEVKCGAAALDIADRQNAHSMTLSVRAIVELFRLVGREMELHQEILAFSISHDHRSVRIYGHYPVIDGKDTKYYRNPIRTFDFTELDGKEKWTAYRFTKSVYDTWMPAHFERLCSAIDKIPADLDFSVPQDLERHRLSESTELESLPREPSQQSISDAGDTTPNTSFTGQGARKRPRKRPAAGQ
ncbi:hypothetical protein Egran_04486 [Elaphomyces granulatus]|uniref:DUF7924 domain-containing protein n=1 Tax=Elaphomyces granulatus TaxID=519963 RepID=A0A232LUB1_9EURO|nr:hypothetical protein Egran_04486 [Elaphomyces granulatus]